MMDESYLSNMKFQPTLQREGGGGSIFEVVFNDIGAFQFIISRDMMITHLSHIHHFAIFMN